MKELIVEASVNHLSGLMRFINAELDALSCPERARAQIKLAVDEIYGNICHYAYGPESGPVTMRLESEDSPPAVTISFADRGKPFNPLEEDEPDVTLDGEDRPIGGLGIFLVQSAMDDLRYAYRDGQNILTLKKNLTDSLPDE